MRSFRLTLAGFLALALAALSPSPGCYAQTARALGKASSFNKSPTPVFDSQVKTVELTSAHVSLSVPGISQASLPMPRTAPAAATEEAFPAASAVSPKPVERIRDASAHTSIQERAVARGVASLGKKVTQALDSAGPIAQADPESARTVGETVQSILAAEEIRAAPAFFAPASSRFGELGRRMRLSAPLKAAARVGNITGRWGLGPVPLLAGAAVSMLEKFESFSMGAKVGAYFLFVLSMIFHEVGHARAALKLGDRGEILEKRASLRPKDLLFYKNPYTGGYELTHLYLIYTIVLPVALILAGAPVIWGMARPVIVHSQNFVAAGQGRAKEGGMAFVAIAGPAVNIGLALAGALVHAALAAMGITGMALQALGFVVWGNIALGLLNLLPFAPLDGHHIARYIIRNVFKNPRLAKYLYGSVQKGMSKKQHAYHIYLLITSLVLLGGYFSEAIEWLCGLLMLS